MLTPLLHSTPRRRLRAPGFLRRWWAQLSHDERQGLYVAAAVVLLLLAVRLLIGSGLGVVR
jgi:hypothetical protein